MMLSPILFVQWKVFHFSRSTDKCLFIMKIQFFIMSTYSIQEACINSTGIKILILLDIYVVYLIYLYTTVRHQATHSFKHLYELYFQCTT